jgi:hypothetical protein
MRESTAASERTIGRIDTVPLKFSLGEDPLTEVEQETFTPDLERLGTSPTAFKILNTALSVKGEGSRLKILRAFRGSDLAGASFFMESRQVGKTFFTGAMATVMDMPKMPVFAWSRYGIGTDHNSNLTFVAPDIDRDAFAERVVRELTKQYMYGSLVDFQDTDAIPGAVQKPGFDSGFIDTDQFDSVDDYIGLRKSLRKKMNAFRNKGGSVSLVRGALAPEEQDAIITLYGTMNHRLLTPFQDIFPRLAAVTAGIDDPNMTHIVTRLDDDVVGYHSFYVGGQTLYCLSGGFDRTRKSTYHAYENLIVKSVEFALEEGLTQINYGPVLNDTKVKMMTRFRTLEVRTYPRYSLFKGVFDRLLDRSMLESEQVKRYRGLQGSPETLTAGGS